MENILWDILPKLDSEKETANVPMLMGTVLGEFTHNYNVKLAEGYKNEWSEEKKS